MHFSASAFYTMKYGPNTSGFLGWSKETFKDWLPGVFGVGEGWDNNDMRANQDGINYGKTVTLLCQILNINNFLINRLSGGCLARM